MEGNKGCGVHINPNGSDLRCGQKEFSPLYGNSSVILCSHCQTVRKLESYQDSFRRITNKGNTMEESRKQFEEWVIGIYGYVTVTRKVNGTQEYSLSEIDKMWKSWKASREAMNEK